jgi:transcriptional regulator with XRE-family HTH domain
MGVFMTKIKKLGYDFLIKLKENKTPPPNDLTIGMGILIKKAREEKGWSQKELADQISSRQSTISDIEQGKNEIGVLTLSVLGLVLNKPISYFFPEGIVKDHLVDITNKEQKELLSMFRELEYIGRSDFALKQIKLLYDQFLEEAAALESGDFPLELTDEEIQQANSDEYEV